MRRRALAAAPARRVLPRLSPAQPCASFFGLADPPRVATAEELFVRVRKLRETVLTPLNTRVLGPLEKASEEMLPLPMVFVLGSHSSGKSTFCNYVLGRAIQKVGEAPTDDGFTVIAPGAEDVDQDGPALVGDPNLGFGNLRQFGSSLVSHLSLKIRAGVKLESPMMIVDSPGMIDSPHSIGGGGASAGGGASSDRGYDFVSAVRWMAERADVILLFQDPAKPGTTGETLYVLTTALRGQDHKTFIILNKVRPGRPVDY
jgi:hypothetical protein